MAKVVIVEQVDHEGVPIYVWKMEDITCLSWCEKMFELVIKVDYVFVNPV